jgi:hypothetical protein
VRLQDWVQGELCEVPITILLTLPTLPICVVTRSLMHSILLTTTAFIAPGLLFQEQIFQHTNSICHSQLKAYSPAIQSPPPPPPWPRHSPVACNATVVTQVTPITIIFVLTTSPSGGKSQATPATLLPVAGKANPATQAILTPLIFIWKKGPSGRVSQVNLVIPTAVLWFTTRIRMMVKQKGCKVAAAAARATKDKQFKALQ